MSQNINNKKNNNLPSLTTNSNTTNKNNTKKKSSINMRNNNNLKNNTKNNINHSNSQITLNKKLTTKNNTTENNNTINILNTNLNNNSVIMNSSLIDIDNFDISSYNPDPYVIPKNKFEHLYISRIEKSVNNYNLIKEIVNQRIEEIELPSNIPLLQVKNFALLDLLDKLNTILDTLIERKRFIKKKDVIDASEKIKNNINNKNRVSKSQEILKMKLTPKEINKKLLQAFKKQHETLTAKYEKLVKEDYIINLKEQIKLLSDDISKLEKTNRELQTNQFKVEYLLKNKNNSTLSEINYKKGIEKYNHFNNEYTMIMKKIPPKEMTVKNNDMQIEQLIAKKESLIKLAKETYDIKNPEEKIVYKLMEDKERTKNEKRRRELEKNILEKENVVKKYNIKKKDNGRYIKQLQEDKKIMEDVLVIKYEELNKLNEKLKKMELENENEIEEKDNQIGYKKLNINNNNNKSSSKNDEKEININNNNNNNISSIGNQISPIKSTDNNISQTKTETLINKISYNNDNIDTNAINNKSDQKEDQEKTKTTENNKNDGKIGTSNNIINNNRYNGLDNNNNNNNDLLLNNNKTYNKKMILEQLDIQKNNENTIKIDSTMNLKKNKFKPNFSFALNDTNKKDKHMNLSVAEMPKTTINKEQKSESEGEIKEDIQINTNINEDKINTNIDNKIEDPKINTNLSQNISIEIEKNNDDDNEGKVRENDFNTLPYDKFENGKNNKDNDNNNNIDGNDNKNDSNDNNVDNYNDNINDNENFENDLLG